MARRPRRPARYSCRWSGPVGELVGRVRATSKKGEKVGLIAEVLRQTHERETELAALYLTGTLPQGRIGVGWRTLQPALPSGPAVGEPLTLARVDEALSAVAGETGPGSTGRRLGGSARSSRRRTMPAGSCSSSCWWARSGRAPSTGW